MPNNNKPPKKSTDAEITARVTTVYKLILNGADRHEILQYAAKMDWNVSDRSVDEYIARATAMFTERAAKAAERAEEKRHERLGIAEAQLNMLFMKCVNVQDYKAALAVRRELSLLLGLHAPTRQEVTGKDGGAIRVSLKDIIGNVDDSGDSFT